MSRITAALIGLMLGLGLSALAIAVLPYYRAADEDKGLAELFGRVELGTEAAATANMLMSRSSGQTLHVLPVSLTKRQWLISSQSRFMQDNWVLVVCIHEEKVVGKRIGIADDISVRPDEAPQPEGSCDR